jgi:hypothetical protein
LWTVYSTACGEELQFADDEIAPALSFDRLKELALDHLGGSPETEDVTVFNRLTGAAGELARAGEVPGPARDRASRPRKANSRARQVRT